MFREYGHFVPQDRLFVRYHFKASVSTIKHCEKTWEEANDVVKQSARINGVAEKMKGHDLLMLAERILKHTDNLSKTLQATEMTAVEAKHLSQLCIKVFEKIKTDESFDLFWALTEQTQKALDIKFCEPTLPRKQKWPRRLKREHQSPAFQMMQNYFTDASTLNHLMLQCLQSQNGLIKKIILFMLI